MMQECLQRGPNDRAYRGLPPAKQVRPSGDSFCHGIILIAIRCQLDKNETAYHGAAGYKAHADYNLSLLFGRLEDLHMWKCKRNKIRRERVISVRLSNDQEIINGL